VLRQVAWKSEQAGGERHETLHRRALRIKAGLAQASGEILAVVPPGDRLGDAVHLQGIEPERLVIDPGIGFGKDLEHNLTVMHHVDALLDLGRPVLVGPSRKRFIGAILDLPEDQRVEGTAGAVAWMVARGAHAVRVHDVKEIARVVRVVDAITRADR